jgi:GT2 family glycosyltransferase
VPGFSIIIPTFDRALLLQRTLDSVLKLRLPPSWACEILVIDNDPAGSAERVVAETAKKGVFPIRYLPELKRGASQARNRGISESVYDHVIFFDDDVVVSGEWLEGYAECQRILSPACVVGPVEPLFDAQVPPWITPGILRKITQAYTRKGGDLTVLQEKAHEIPGCNFGVLKSVVRQAGGFDVRLGFADGANIGGEDFYFGYELRRLGKPTVYAPRCSIKHSIGEKKLSVSGLRARYERDGASERVILQLQSRNPTFKRESRLFFRMVRLFSKSWLRHLMKDTGSALELELQGRQISGFLFGSPYK